MENYILGKQIGSGAYAIAYIGTDRRTNKKVAFKIYLKEKMKDL
jgi:serine/threonine protein kinase